MSSIRVQRINFIEKAPFVFTYRKIVLVGGLLLGVFLLIYGFQTVRILWLGRGISRLSDEVIHLKVERERVLKETAATTGSGPASARSALLKVMEGSLTWSVLLRELSAETPRALWLTSVKSYDKAGSPPRKGMLLNGQAEDASAVSLFLKSLSESPHFDNVVLTSSKEEGGAGGPLYQFSIDVGIRPSPRGVP